MPAAKPPASRATTSTESVQARAASSDAGMARVVPQTSILLRPYRSPITPSHSIEDARPSEYPTAIRSSVVCPESKCWPIDGRATFATGRLRLATAATRIRVTSTTVGRSGAVLFPGAARTGPMLGGEGRTASPRRDERVRPIASRLRGPDDREQRVLHRRSGRQLVGQARELGRGAPLARGVHHVVAE